MTRSGLNVLESLIIKLPAETYLHASPLVLNDSTYLLRGADHEMK